MPDVTSKVGLDFVATDDVTPTLNKIKGAIDEVTKSTADLVEEGRVLTEGFERAGISVANAMRLATQEQKAAIQAYQESIGPGAQAEKEQFALRTYGMELENWAAKTLKAEEAVKTLADSQLEAAKAAQVMAMFEQRVAEVMEHVAEREQAVKDQSALRQYGMELENWAAKALKAEEASKALAASQLEAAKAAQVMAMFEQRNAEVMAHVAEYERHSIRRVEPQMRPKVLGGDTGEEIEETTRKTRGMVAEFGMLAEQFVKWGLIWQVFEQGIKLVGDAINQFTTETKVAEQAQNSFGLSAEESQGYLEKYYQAAHRAGMTWDEWQKFAPGAINALEATGRSAGDAVIEVSNLGKEFDLTGVDLRKLAPAVELGTASFAQLAEAGRIMGPAWTQAVTDLAKVEASEKGYQKALQQDHALQRQAIQDAHELANARRGIAEATGVAKGTFEAFQQAQASGAGMAKTFDLDLTFDQLAGLTPAMAKALSRLSGEQQKVFLQGEEQLAKELGVNLKDVRSAVAAGIPGFDEKALSGAQKRAEHEKDTSDERNFQQKNQERTNELEAARLYYNNEVASRLHDQDNLLKAQPDSLKIIKMAEEDRMHAVEKATAAINKQNQDLSLVFSRAGGEPTYGFPSWAAPGVKGFPGTPPAGGPQTEAVSVKTNGEKLATYDEALTAAIRDLITMLQGS